MHDPLLEMDDEIIVRSLSPSQMREFAVRGSAVTAVSQSVRMVISITSQIVLARLLFPEDFGLVAMAGPVIAFIALFSDIGFGQILIQRPVLHSSTVSTLFWVSVALSTAVAILLMAVSPIIAYIYSEPRLIQVLLYLALLIPLSALAVHPNALMNRHMRFATLARNDVCVAIASTLSTIIFAFFGLGVWSLIAGQFVSTICAIILAWLSCTWRPSLPAIDKRAWTEMRFGGSITGSNIASYVTTTGDDIVVGVVGGAQSLGLYDRSYRLVVQPIGQILTPVGRVAIPLLSRLTEHPAQYTRSFTSMLRWICAASIPLMLVCIFFGREIIVFLLGARWESAAGIFSWICVGGLLSAVNTSTYWLFVSQGRGRDLLFFTVVNSFVAILSFLIGSFWGAQGVAAAAALAFTIVIVPISVFGGTRTGPVSLLDFAKTTWPLAIATLTISAVLLSLSRVPTIGGFIDIVLMFALSYVGFALVLLLLPNGRMYVNELRHGINMGLSYGQRFLTNRRAT